MTRNDARELFRAKGLDYSALTQKNLRQLISRIDAAMVESGLIGGSYRMRRGCAVKILGDRPWAALRCKSNYFNDREAVTFNPDGFVGLAGWADDENIVPVLTGFERWCVEMAASQER